MSNRHTAPSEGGVPVKRVVTRDGVRSFERATTSVLAIAVSKDGRIALVRDHSKKYSLYTPEPQKVYWKLPGGGTEAGETDDMAILRELLEETGLCATEEQLTHLLANFKNELHCQHLYLIVFDALNGLKERGDEGEEVRAFSTSEFNALGDDFLPEHRELMERWGALNKRR